MTFKQAKPYEGREEKEKELVEKGLRDKEVLRVLIGWRFEDRLR